MISFKKLLNKNLSGDILDIIANTLRHEYVLKAYQYMNYDAWIAGDQDFIEGIDFFNKNHMNLNMTLVNMNIKTLQSQVNYL